MANNSHPLPFHSNGYEHQHLLGGPASEILSRSNDDSNDTRLTPLQLGRLELYELIPFTAVFGMQLKSKNVVRAFAGYASDVQSVESSFNTIHLQPDSKRRETESLLAELDAVSMANQPLILAIIVSGMSQFLVGYNTAALNVSHEAIFANHTTWQWSLAVSVFALGGLFGTYASSCMESYGRRKSIFITSVMYFVGSLMQSFALSIRSMTLGRLVIGVASGISTVLIPVYLGELAPPTLRGTLGTYIQFCYALGILISNLLAYQFANEQSWRLSFFLAIGVSIMQILCCTCLVESPRWLITKDPKSIRARKIIKQLRGLRYGHEVDTEISHMIHASQVQSCDQAGEQIRNMMQDKRLRTLLICSVFLQVAQQLSGINAVFYYSSSIFEGFIDGRPSLYTVMIGVANFAATFVASMIIERSNRRKLIFGSLASMCLLSIAFVLSTLGYFNKSLSLCFIVCYVSSYAIGLGPIPRLMTVEMFEAKYVNSAMHVSCKVNWGCNFIVGISFPYIQELLGPYSLAPFSVLLLLLMGCALVLISEAKGTTQEELRVDTVRSLSSMFAISDDSTCDGYGSSIGNIDIEWRRAMDDLRRQECEAMIRGTYNYGFQPIEQKVEDGNHSFASNNADWKSYVTGSIGI